MTDGVGLGLASLLPRPHEAALCLFPSQAGPGVARGSVDLQTAGCYLCFWVPTGVMGSVALQSGTLAGPWA